MKMVGGSSLIPQTILLNNKKNTNFDGEPSHNNALLTGNIQGVGGIGTGGPLGGVLNS